MNKQQNEQIFRITALLVVGLLFLLHKEPSQKAAVNLFHCDREKCYLEASICGANHSNSDDLWISDSCQVQEVMLDGEQLSGCENLTINGQQLQVNKKENSCQTQFTKCTNKCENWGMNI